ncbi:cell wall hydrolase [Dethiobacter alkaliphilus]|uniref:cell wall hydrolase n=1 Tax=Dethiobacter alkaliphilus TaxID=427926 RepID=UPI002227B56A|nr:cell wall hydrolase [Dethiobacter alkaliphilus]MCW3489952.1 cell wall hydrolase [Dethiobacter alkaliphilus]
MKNRTMVTRVTAIMLILFFVLGTVAQAVNEVSFGERTIRITMRGEDVAELQEFLNEQGYRDEDAHGIFGPLTYGSLQQFQKDHGLNPDGIVGPKTRRLIQEMMGETVSAAESTVEASTTSAVADEFNFTAEEMDLFARIVHAEAEGESFEGQVAVAAAILNRVRSDRYPNTMTGVVYQVEGGYYQYSPVLDGRINRPAGESAKRAAQEALDGNDPSWGATGFYNPAKTSNQWVRQQPVTRTIGGHVFFR